MEYEYTVAPSHPQHPLYDDEPTNSMVVEDEEEYNEEKPVLKSVKDKVDFLEDIITKNTNGDDKYHEEEEGERYHEDDEYIEVNPEVHGATMYESAVLGGRDEPTKLNPDELGVSPDVVSSLQAMVISEQPEVQQQCNQTPSGHEDESQMGHESSEVEKKPSYTEKLSSTAAAAKDAAVSAASTVYSKIAGTVSGQPEEPTPVETPKKPSYTDRLSSTATAAKDVAVSAASTLYAKMAGKEEVTHETHDQVEELKDGDAEKKGSYTEKLSSTAMAAKDTAVSAASTVYGKVAGATVAGQPGSGTEQDKVVLMREYLAEKLRPGEEDRALCEVISESMQKNREEEEVNLEQKKVAGWDGTIG